MDSLTHPEGWQAFSPAEVQQLPMHVVEGMELHIPPGEQAQALAEEGYLIADPEQAGALRRALTFSYQRFVLCMSALSFVAIAALAAHRL